MDDLSRTHYEVLGVGHNASLDEIRAAHRHLALMLHPDHHLASPDSERQLAERRMREVNEAWTVLSNEKHRSEYDQAIRLASSGTDYTGSTPSRSSSGTSDGAARSPSSDHDVKGIYDTPIGTHGDFVDGQGHHINALFFESDDEDEPVASPLARFASPVVVLGVLALALGIFVFTAYAGPGSKDSRGSTAAKKAPVGQCVNVQADKVTVITVPCDAAADGEIVAVADRPSDCPGGTTSGLLDTKQVCVGARAVVMSNSTGD